MTVPKRHLLAIAIASSLIFFCFHYEQLFTEIVISLAKLAVPTIALMAIFYILTDAIHSQKERLAIRISKPRNHPKR